MRFFFPSKTMNLRSFLGTVMPLFFSPGEGYANSLSISPSSTRLRYSPSGTLSLTVRGIWVYLAGVLLHLIENDSHCCNQTWGNMNSY